MKLILLLLGLFICQPLLASAGPLKPTGHYGTAVQNTRLNTIEVRTYYPTQKKIDTPTLQATPILYSRFPALIFMPDQKKRAQDYEGLIVQLVSHGYIVIAINNAFAGKPIDNLLALRLELNKTSGPLAKLSKHMQLNHIGLMGCTKGSKATTLAIRNYPQLFSAAIALNETQSQLGSSKTPFMRLVNSHMTSLKKVKLFANNFIISVTKNKLKTDNSQLIDYYVLQFFDMYLKGITSNSLAHCLSVSKGSKLNCGKYKIRQKELSLPHIANGPHQQVSGMLRRFGAIN